MKNYVKIGAITKTECDSTPCRHCSKFILEEHGAWAADFTDQKSLELHVQLKTQHARDPVAKQSDLREFPRGHSSSIPSYDYA